MPNQDHEVVADRPLQQQDRAFSGPKALVLAEPQMRWLEQPRDRVIKTLGESLYVGAKPESIEMVLNYCEAARLNVMLKPVHLVPMSVKVPGTRDKYEWRDVIMPGIGHYRTQADRTGTYLGVSEPEFGPMIELTFGGSEKKYRVPEWCKVTVKRAVGSHIAEFTAIEYWEENFATAGREKPWPNTMWAKRPRGQIAKCAEAQALRKAFPELGGEATAEEMEGKVIDLTAEDVSRVPVAATRSLDHFAGGEGQGDEGGVEGEETDESGASDDAQAELNDKTPKMPAAALKAFVEKQDWQPGWKWLNKAFDGLTQRAKQELAEAHAPLLWAVYHVDSEAKGPQSKAAAEFTVRHKITVPAVDGSEEGGDGAEG